MNTTNAKTVANAIVANEKTFDELVEILATALPELDYTLEAVAGFAKSVKGFIPKGLKPNVGNIVNACCAAGGDRKVAFWFTKGLGICKDPSIIPHLDKLYGQSKRQAKANASKTEKTEVEKAVDYIEKLGMSANQLTELAKIIAKMAK